MRQPLDGDSQAVLSPPVLTLLTVMEGERAGKDREEEKWIRVVERCDAGRVQVVVISGAEGECEGTKRKRRSRGTEE